MLKEKIPVIEIFTQSPHLLYRNIYTVPHLLITDGLEYYRQSHISYLYGRDGPFVI